MPLTPKAIHQYYQDANFTLHVMHPKFSEIDYELVMRNQVRLRQLFAGQTEWPKPDMTVADNTAAMEHHLREFNENIAYGFCVFDADNKECIGTVYIDASEVDGYDCELHYWLDESLIALEAVLKERMLTWLKDKWGFDNPALVAREIPLAQWQNMKKAS
ncbi:GNAT family N-acetyltransferase [Pseudoalteromonas sp. JBTF-M23]|uniref:GNAT family N-acetyltransferase n=1 Tax=Pseudoalteromonas caenipelagi TaxID=2726988 RepID=A0A849VM77_9GAMM|nr:GNAT family N-acetyltransferase [Pseudoalteromonas caenipelagi]NOU52687.1 GNAT family N-acetyltransferase [Pseudoalteromonas caenipelagi]